MTCLLCMGTSFLLSFQSLSTLLEYFCIRQHKEQGTATYFAFKIERSRVGICLFGTKDISEPLCSYQNGIRFILQKDLIYSSTKLPIKEPNLPLETRSGAIHLEHRSSVQERRHHSGYQNRSLCIAYHYFYLLAVKICRCDPFQHRCSQSRLHSAWQ